MVQSLANTKMQGLSPTYAYTSEQSNTCPRRFVVLIIDCGTIRAGHEVPAYTVGNLPRGLHALTMFKQANAGLPISST
jgi:hypothetical protein